MEQRQISFSKALSKGEYAEGIIKAILEEKGFIVYQPQTKGKPHYFDILATRNKDYICILEVKAKARMNNVAATGIDRRHYREYLKCSKDLGVPFFLCFVDEFNADVHYQEITKLTNECTEYYSDKIIKWYISDMIKIDYELSEEQKQILKSYNQRSYEYKPTG